MAKHILDKLIIYTRQDQQNLAWEVMRQNRRFALGRGKLIAAAIAAGRSEEAAKKASSMRLSRWILGEKSAI